MPEFFIPAAEDKAQEERVYKAIREYVSGQVRGELSEERIYRVRYVHEGTEYVATVGEPHKMNGEPVVAILRAPIQDLYCVCTANRGVTRGGPILVGAHTVKAVCRFSASEE